MGADWKNREPDWQEKDPYIHYCCECFTFAPVIPCDKKGLRHIGCKGLIFADEEVTKEQFVNMSDEEKQAVRDSVIKVFEFARQNPVNYASPNRPALVGKCPMCNSTNFSRITTGARMVSVMTFGLASSSIGKQYKCNKCGHKW